MKVFKFGGASVKDANSVKNLLHVLRIEGYKDLIIVISAMGKMTNYFEKIADSYIRKSVELPEEIAFVKIFHLQIINELFEDKAEVINEIENLLTTLELFFKENRSKDYNFIYDQIVGYGELISTKIIGFYLKKNGIENNWLDVRTVINTDQYYRGAHVNWKLTENAISKIDTKKLTITQGFLGADLKGNTTTLGREGSDYTAAIFGYCLNAKSITIWKDVNGVLNADPKHFNETKLLRKISYKEAIEMSFYGASVIHPKTLKPLENKNIPLIVRSFYNLQEKGTLVGKGYSLTPEIPCFILKKHQILVSISALDFSFMVENNLSHIFKMMYKYKLKVNLIQNSALSFSVCVDDKFSNFQLFLSSLKRDFNVNYVKNVSLYTIRHSTEKSIDKIENKGKTLLKQITKGTVQLVME